MAARGGRRSQRRGPGRPRDPPVPADRARTCESGDGRVRRPAAALEHLPVDPTRTYAEDTLYWVIWYVGAPAVLLGGFGLALLVRRSLRALLTWKDVTGAARNWALPLAIIGWGSAAVLW